MVPWLKITICTGVTGVTCPSFANCQGVAVAMLSECFAAVPAARVIRVIVYVARRTADRRPKDIVALGRLLLPRPERREPGLLIGRWQQLLKCGRCDEAFHFFKSCWEMSCCRARFM